jgi:hypothetical protein
MRRELEGISSRTYSKATSTIFLLAGVKRPAIPKKKEKFIFSFYYQPGQGIFTTTGRFYNS